MATLRDKLERIARDYVAGIKREYNGLIPAEKKLVRHYADEYREMQEQGVDIDNADEVNKHSSGGGN